MPKKKHTPTLEIPKIVQLPSGSWRCQVYTDGRSVSITDKDPNVVMAKAMALKAGITKARKPVEDMTLREACEKYIVSRKNRMSPTTAEGYRKYMRNYFQGIMDRRIKNITNQMLDAAVEAEAERGISPKTIKNAYRFLCSVFKRYCPDTDYNVDLPEPLPVASTICTAEEIIPLVIGTPIELPCLLAAWLSFTMSEVKGLTKSKSIQGDYILVVETVVRVAGKDIRKAGGKELRRSRALPLPPYIRHLIDQVEGDIIVPMPADTIRKHLRRILKDANLPPMSFHKLRHLNASVMAMLGVDEKTAQQRGGWKTESIMKEIYTHSFESQQLMASQKMDNYFSRLVGISHDDFTRK